MAFDGEGLIEAVHAERFGWWFRPFYVTNNMGNVCLMPWVYSALFDLTRRWYQEETSKKQLRKIKRLEWLKIVKLQ